RAGRARHRHPGRRRPQGPGQGAGPERPVVDRPQPRGHAALPSRPHDDQGRRPRLTSALIASCTLSRGGGMRLSVAVAALVVAGAAVPARADKKLDDAVAKAEAQLARGKEDEAVKILQKAAAQAPRDAEPQMALAQLLARLGKLDDASAALGRAGELSASASPAVKARVLAARSSMALRTGPASEALALAQQAVQAEGGAPSLAA